MRPPDLDQYNNIIGAMLAVLKAPDLGCEPAGVPFYIPSDSRL